MSHRHDHPCLRDRLQCRPTIAPASRAPCGGAARVA